MNILRCTLFAILLALVMGIGCGDGKEKVASKTEPKVNGTLNAEPKGEANATEPPKETPEKFITDPIVEKAIRSKLKKPKGELTKADLAKVTSLYLAGRKITNTSLTEVAKLKNLASLSLSYTKITDMGLQDVAKLKNLTNLWLGGTTITDMGLKEVAKLKNLTSLNLFKTQITDMGLKEVAKLKNLTWLNLSATQVTEAEVARLRQALPTRISIVQTKNVTGMPKPAKNQEPPKVVEKKLIVAPLVETKIREKLGKPTGKLTRVDFEKLTGLNLRNNQLTEVPKGLEKLTELKVLSLENNKVKDLSILKHLEKLKELRLGDNRLNDINTLPELDQLGALFLENNTISDLRPILRLKNLTSLSVGGYDQIDFDTIRKLNNLKELNISGSSLTDQQLAVVANELPNLKHLFICYNPKISNLLPLETFKKLEIIDVDDRPNLRIQIETLQKSLPKLKARYYAP